MILLAFPGMGKTPLALKKGKYYDADFGLFRTALGYSKEEEDEILDAFARYIKSIELQGFTVLTNEPKIMRYAKVKRMFLPKYEWRSSRKLGVEPDEAAHFIEGWRLEAKKYGVPVITIDVGLDHYLG